jgi:HD-GYP domain-containing protein (c-di-GMP phosphodiesterase class II)
MSSNHNEKQDLLGEETLRTFHKLIQTARIHQDSNQLLVKCISDFSARLRRWWAEDDGLTIKLSRGRFLIQDEKLWYHPENLKLVREMYQFFEGRNLAGLCFHAGGDGFSSGSVLSFIRLLSEAGEKENPFEWTAQELDKGPYTWVELLQLPKSPAVKKDPDRKKMARKTYAHALVSLKEVAEKINSERKTGVRKLKRIAQNMVDILSEDESVMLGISTMRDYDDYTYTHSVNVAILSLCLGKRIGLSRISLSYLAICGLLHDLGKLNVPKKILNKPGKLTDHEFKEMQKHPINSVSQIVRLNAPEDLKAKILLPPFEHHLKYDLSGYPTVRNKQSVSLFGRIITITDVFDALTSPRVYRPEAMSPNHALEIMIKESGRDFDPILLKVFINMLGVYPVGTLVKLDTGEMGLVVAGESDGDPTRPCVVLVVRNGNDAYVKGKTVDLSARRPDSGSFRKNIINSCHPSRLGIQPSDFIL